MKTAWIILGGLLGVVALVHADDIVTTDGQIYSNAKVSRADPLGVHITHRSGVARVLFREMTETDRKKYGHDPLKEEAFILQEQQRREAAEQTARDLAKRRAEEAARQERQQEQRLAAQEEARKAEVARQEQALRDLFKPSDISVAAFHATRPKEVTVFSARAKLDDYFNWDFSDNDNPRVKDIYWSVEIKTRDGDRIGNGYIRKDGRGAALFELIKDGKWHAIVARVRYPPQSQDSGVFLLEDFKEAPPVRESDDE